MDLSNGVFIASADFDRLTASARQAQRDLADARRERDEAIDGSTDRREVEAIRRRLAFVEADQARAREAWLGWYKIAVRQAKRIRELEREVGKRAAEEVAAEAGTR